MRPSEHPAASLGALARCLVLASVACLIQSSSLAAAERATDEEQVQEAQFRGCETAGWCRFRIVSAEPGDEALLRVRPLGVAYQVEQVSHAMAVRDRLNALLSDMIHQSKHIELGAPRQLADGTSSARVTVHGIDVATDPDLRALGARAEGPRR